MAREVGQALRMVDRGLGQRVELTLGSGPDDPFVQDLETTSVMTTEVIHPSAGRVQVVQVAYPRSP